ncbi:MAG: OmpA family protein [Victivallaceae bacterium]
MFSKKSFVGAMVLAAAVVFSGCVDNQIPEETGLNNIPGAAGDPRNAGMSTGDTLGFDAVPGEDGWAAGADEGSIAGGALHDAGWPVVEGIEFPIIYFDFDRDEIRPSEREAIQQVANYMNTYPELGLIIEGHTDDVGTNEYNRALGERRALAVMNAMNEYGVGVERIRTISYGEDAPAAQGTDAQSRVLNRRAVMLPAQMQ